MAATGSGGRKDPLTTFLFGLKISGLIEGPDAIFKSIGGLKFETEVVELQEGGVSMFTRKVVGVTKWSNITLKQGFTGTDMLWKWKMNPVRRNGTILQLGQNMKVMCKWNFSNGWPVKWVGPDYDASKNELAIEEIEIAHEGLEMTQES